MDLYLLFSSAFVVGLSGALMPGPVTAVLAEHALKRGFWAGPLVTLGHGLIESFMVALLAAGVSAYMTGRGPAGIIGIAGGFVLAWMGWGMFRSARSGSLSLRGEEAEGRKGPVTGSVAAGMVTTLSNPYWFLWWVTVGAGFVSLSRQHGPGGLLLFFSGHILADLAWLSILAAILVLGKSLISDKIYRAIVAGLGIFLMAFSLYFLWTGITRLFGI